MSKDKEPDENTSLLLGDSSSSHVPPLTTIKAGPSSSSSIRNFEEATSYNNLTNAAKPSKKQYERPKAPELPNIIRFPYNYKKAKYAVTTQECDITDFIDNHLFAGELGLRKPQAIIYVTGGAKYFEVDSTLDSVIRRGLIKAASKLNAWIIDGGMKAGVMKYIGKCVKTMSMEPIKCIGVATLGKVNNHEKLKKNESFEYTVLPDKQRHQDLDPNHTHFILVGNNKPEPQIWGEEIPFLDNLLATLHRDHNIPVVSVAINGGYTALDIMANSITQGFSTILVDGTGRACDAVSQLVRVAKKHNMAPEHATLKKIRNIAVGSELDSWNKLWEEMIGDGYYTKKTEEHTKPVVDKILRLYNKLTFFDPYEVDSEGLDSVIYKCLLTKIPAAIPTDDPVAQKLLNLIRWTDRADFVTDLLCHEIHRVKTPPANVLAEALAYALIKNRHQIFDALCDFHAQFNKPLSSLYSGKVFAGVYTYRKIGFSLIPQDAFVIPGVTDRKISNNPGFNGVLDILTNVGPVSTVYANLCSQYYSIERNEDDRMSEFVDILVWAVFKQYDELAKVIWKRTRYPLHSALLVCNLHPFLFFWYRHLSQSEFRAHEFLAHADWYENEAVKILNSVEYRLAKKLIKFSSPRMLGKATLEDLASEGNCKAVMSHPHMQQYFDEMLYSFKGSAVIAKPNRSNLWLVLLIITFIPRYTYNRIIGKPKAEEVPFPRKYSDATPRDRSNTIGRSGIMTKEQQKLFEIFEQEEREKEEEAREKQEMKKGKEKEPARDEISSRGEATPLLDPPVAPPLPPRKLRRKNLSYLDKIPEANFHVFFNIPIVKFWTSTIFYLGFLFLQAFVLLNFKNTTIKPEEYFLWAWVASMVLEEFLEIYNKHGRGYFYQFTNQIDMGLIVLHSIYIVLRLIQVQITLDPEHWSAAVNCLLLASVLSWLRLMCVFPVSSTFGPLFFILIRLMTDLVVWFALFSIFAISFQIAFASLAIQAGVDPRLTYPDANGTFPVSLVTVVGEWSYLVDVMSDTPAGLFYIAIYAFIVNVMFINLLIAMMGSTYSTVKENSDVEWKYYRCGFVRDSMTTSAFPPPINFIELCRVLYRMYRKLLKKKDKAIMLPLLEGIGQEDKLQKEEEKKEAMRMDKMSKVMRVSLDIIRAEDEHNESQSPLVQIKIVKKEARDLRTVLDKHQNLMTSMMATIVNINQSIDAIKKQMGVTSIGHRMPLFSSQDFSMEDFDFKN